MASAAFNQSITTDEVKIFDSDDDEGACTSFFVHCTAGSTAPVLVNVPGLHKSGDYAPVRQGETIIFRLGHLGIREVYAKTNSGTATVDYGVLAKTVAH